MDPHSKDETLSQDVAPLRKRIYEITRTPHIRERRKGWRKVKEATKRRLSEREEEEELQVLTQRFPHGIWKES